jgi:6-phosphogluconolactonase
MPAVLLSDSATAADLDAALADFVGDRLAEAINARGRAGLVVSGGNTPKGFLQLLSHKPLRWSQVFVTLSDERWLPPTHEDSNERMVRGNLLKNAARGANLLPLYDGSSTPVTGLSAATMSLSRMPRPFDVVMLGMGVDGHIASLFPGDASAQDLSEAGSPCISVKAPASPNVQVARISLSAASLLDCRCLILHIVGQAKHRVLEQALEPGPVAALPVRLVLHQNKVPCRVFWARSNDNS